MPESRKARAAEARRIEEDFRAYLLRKENACEDELNRDPGERTVREFRAQLRKRDDEERRALGRELRDCTGLELLQIADALDDATTESAIEREKVETLREHMDRLAARVRALSARLYPSVIEDMGLVVALRSACEAAQAASSIDIRFSANQPSSPVPREVSLCLHRVLNEALSNALRHADTRHIAVSLERGADELILSVADHGVGFDLQTAYKKGGLGLVNMVEQVDELGGRLAIESVLGAGTRIVATVPLGREGQ